MCKEGLMLVRRSCRPNRAWMVTFECGRSVHVGSPGVNTFGRGADKERRRAQYRARYGEQLKRFIEGGGYWPMSPMFWNYYLLHNKPTIAESVEDIKRQFPGTKIAMAPRVSCTREARRKMLALQKRLKGK